MAAGSSAGAAPKPKPPAITVIGTFRIPALKVKKKIYQGTHKRVLNKGGFCLWNGTAAPTSTTGHSAYFAHRTTAGGPAKRSHLLNIGDEILVNDVSYRVTSKAVVPRSQWGTGLTDVSGGRTLAIVTCSKANGLPTSLKHRLIIRAAAV
jgi:LPXTG-site transpeptidase (sortase) family protein